MVRQVRFGELLWVELWCGEVWHGRCGKVCQCTASRDMVVRVLARFGGYVKVVFCLGSVRFVEFRCGKAGVAGLLVVSWGIAWLG